MPYTKKLNDLKDELNLTNRAISDGSGVPLGTVNRIFAGQTENPSFDHIAAIVRFMGGSLDEIAGIPCRAHKTTHSEDSDRVIAIYQKQLDDINAIHEKRIHDKNLWIKFLFGLVALLIVGYILFVTLDFSHHDDLQQGEENASYSIEEFM